VSPRRTEHFWRDRSVLVTGATGLVGGWLVKRLVAAGASVVAIVRDWVPQAELVRAGLLDQVGAVRGDVRDQELLERVLGEFEVETVLHLAAQAIVGIANANPSSTFESNIAGTWRLLEACRRSPRVKQIVLASSDKAYGDAPDLPYTEETPLRGRHPYDVSKSCADLIAQSYFATYELPVAITRCGNFFGGGDLNWNRIVPGTIRAVARGERPVIRSDGQFVRDYFYVEDGAAAYMHLAEQLAMRPELAGHAFNFSNENQITVLELVHRILAAMGSDVQPLVLGQASHEIRRQHLSAAKARRMLRWRPLFSLEEGLTRTISWYRNHLQTESDHMAAGMRSRTAESAERAA
jgi:CDP-glucose 4,6-dehydratase